MGIFNGVKESTCCLSNLCLDAWYGNLLKSCFSPETNPDPSTQSGPLVICFFSSSTCPMIMLISLYYNYFLFCQCILSGLKRHKVRLSVLFIIVCPEPGKRLTHCRCLVSISWMNELVKDGMKWFSKSNSFFWRDLTITGHRLLKIINSHIL